MKTTTTLTRSQALGLLMAAVVALSATAGFAAAATTTDLTVSITDDDDTVATGETTTVKIAVANADDGVGAAELGVELSDPGVATITDVTVLHTPGNTDNNITGGGAATDIKYGFADSPDTGEVTIVEVTLQAAAEGSTDINLVENDQTGNLVVFDENGAGYTLDNVESSTLTVGDPNAPPDADAGGDQTVQAGDTVTLDGSDSIDPDGSIASYSWTETTDFGVSLSDADTAAPTFTAPDVNSETTLEFQLEVTDDDGTIKTDTVDVTVQPPDAANFQVSNLEAPGSAEQGEKIDVSATVENIGDQTATKTVEFRIDTDGDGSIADESGLANQSVQLDAGASTTVTFADVDTGSLAPDNYTHGVATSDDSATAQITIEAANEPPTANAGADQTVDEETTVTLDGTVSSDTDADTLSYSWTQTGGPDVSLSDASAAQPTFTAPPVGSETTLTFQVEVSDGQASDTDTVNVTVQPLEPAAADFLVSNLQAPGSATQGDTIDVSATVENTGGQQATKTVEFRLDDSSDDLGDGDDDVALSQEVTLDGSESTTVTFENIDTTGLTAGNYIHGIATPDDGATAQITIEEPAPADFQVSNLSAPGTATQGDAIDVSADVINVGEQADTQSVEFRIDADGDGFGDADDVVLTRDVQLEPEQSTTVTFTDIDTSGLDAGGYTHGVFTENDSATATLTVEAAEEGPPPVGDFENTPTDPDGDGLYEDINGDGVFDIVDVQALFANLDDETVQDENYLDAFDFNGDGTVDVVDVQKLFTEEGT